MSSMMAKQMPDDVGCDYARRMMASMMPSNVVPDNVGCDYIEQVPKKPCSNRPGVHCYTTTRCDVNVAKRSEAPAVAVRDELILTNNTDVFDDDPTQDEFTEALSDKRTGNVNSIGVDAAHNSSSDIDAATSISSISGGSLKKRQQRGWASPGAHYDNKPHSPGDGGGLSAKECYPLVCPFTSNTPEGKPQVPQELKWLQDKCLKVKGCSAKGGRNDAKCTRSCNIVNDKFEKNGNQFE